MVLGEVQLLEFENEARVLPANRRQEPLPHLLRIFVGEEPNPDLARDATSADLRKAPEVRGVIEQLRRERQQLGSGAGEEDGFARALEQQDAELTLERLDLLTDRRLGNVQLLGGAPEVQLASDSNEVLELPELHAFSPCCTRRHAEQCDRQYRSTSDIRRVPIAGGY
jgi:hypothetical protein